METTSCPADTSAEAFAVQLECLRKMSPSERIRRTCTMSRRVRNMAMDAIRRRHPALGEDEVQLLFIELTYGKTLADGIRQGNDPALENGATTLSETDDLVDALAPVVDAFRRLGIRHFVGGSVASSFHGATRSTMDVDVVCELTEDKISPFVASFEKTAFYVSEAAVRDAVRRKSCFNLIHFATSFKVDVFVSRGRPFDLESMRRATTESLGESAKVLVPVATAEDSIISKLEWYRLTNETSDRQWDDVSKLMRLLGDKADLVYLRRAAAMVGVSDLLDRLLGHPS